MTMIDLLPAHHRLSRRRQIRRRGWMMAGVIGLAVMTLWTAAASMQWMSLRSQIAQAREVLAPWRGHLAELQAVRKERDTLASQVAMLDRLRDPIPLPAVLALLSQVCPDQAVIEQMQILVPDPVFPLPTTATRKGKPAPRHRDIKADPPPGLPITLQLEGLAATDVVIARMASQLADTGLFRHVRIDSAQPVQVHGKSVHQFRLSIEIPSLPSANRSAVAWGQKQDAMGDMR